VPTPPGTGKEARILPERNRNANSGNDRRAGRYPGGTLAVLCMGAANPAILAGRIYPDGRPPTRS